MRISKESETNIEDVIENLPDTEVDDYLHKQFFDRLPEDTQRFLRKICVLLILDENACKFVMGTDKYDETFCSNKLIQLKNLLVLDDVGKVKKLRLYRLHDLFRDFLMMSEASLPELHLKAADYYKNKIEKSSKEGADITDVRFALYHLQESKDINAFVNLLNTYEEGLRILGYIKELFVYFNNTCFEKITESNVKSATLHNYGLTLELLGMYEEALEKYNQSLNIKEKLNNQIGIAVTLHQIAVIHYLRGECEEALEKYNQSLNIKEKFGDQMGIAAILNNIATIHKDKGEYEEALEKYNQSLNIKEKFGDQMGIAVTLRGIAMIHHYKGEYEEVFEKYNQSLEIHEELGDLRGIAQTLHGIAIIHQDKGEYEEAFEKYNQSLEIHEELGDLRGIAYIMAQMGLLYSDIDEKDKAIEFTQKALNIFEKIRLKNDAIRAKAQIESIRQSS